MKPEDVKKHVETLMGKAAGAEKSDDALKFSQAACNTANAFASLDYAINREHTKE